MQRSWSTLRSLSTVTLQGGQVRFSGMEGVDPVDLLDPKVSRNMQKTAAGQSPTAQQADFPTEGGRMIIREEAADGR